MKQHYLLTLALLAPTLSAWAQCTFTPTIEPGTLILCPNEGGVLSTQAYSAYQWYKDGNAIAGATGQQLTVQSDETGSSFTVAATLDGCTETSASVLVDGWMFLLPYLIHGGDEPYSTGPFGEPFFCEGDTLTLTLGQPYTENITWTNNGNPIPGETSNVLTVTTTGLYSASGAPGVCPNQIMYVGVEVGATFNTNMQPDIVDNGNDQLCAYPAGGATQWYLAGAPVDTGACITPTASGPYTVFVDYGQPCQTVSEPWITTGVDPVAATRPTLMPNPAREQLTISWPNGTAYNQGWVLRDLLGRPVLNGRVPASGTLTLDVRSLADGNYLLAPADRSWKPLQVVVSH